MAVEQEYIDKEKGGELCPLRRAGLREIQKCAEEIPASAAPGILSTAWWNGRTSACRTSEFWNITRT